MTKLSARTLSLLFLLLATLPACSDKVQEGRIRSLQEEVAALKKNLETFRPGLGEIMTSIHLHHAKLYFAGKSKNWALARYQIDEIKEDLEQAAELPDSPVRRLRALIDPSLKEIAGVIAQKDNAHLGPALAKLTRSCNQCHQAAEHGYIVIQAPTTPLFTNQNFATPK